MSNRNRPIKHLPTPEEIEQETAYIRAGWDRATERLRRAIPSEPLTLPMISVMRDGILRSIIILNENLGK